MGEMNDLDSVGLEQKKYFVPALNSLHTKFVLILLKITPFPFPFPDLTVKVWAAPSPEEKIGKVLLHMAPQGVLCLSLEYTNASGNVILVECGSTNLELC